MLAGRTDGFRRVRFASGRSIEALSRLGVDQDSSASIARMACGRNCCNQKIADLRLGLAVYYCKIVEQELVSRLIEPFSQSNPQFRPDEFDKELRDIQRFLEHGRTPGLGGIAYALSAAVRPEKHEDTRLLQSWRMFLASISEPQRSSIRRREFLDDLKTMADARNRVAHLGDLSGDEFVRVERAVIEGDRPGSMLRALGVE